MMQIRIANSLRVAPSIARIGSDTFEHRSLEDAIELAPKLIERVSRRRIAPGRSFLRCVVTCDFLTRGFLNPLLTWL
jgi:hypothetical protein